MPTTFARSRRRLFQALDSITYYVMAAPGSDEWDGWSAGRDRNEDQLGVNPYVSRE